MVRDSRGTIDRLLHPRSVAIFGGAEAEEVVRQCVQMGFAGDLWPVHPTKESVLDLPVYRSVADLPGSPDAAYVAVNRKLTIDIVKDLATVQAGGVICFATGYGEAGARGLELEEDLRTAAGSMPLLGPNCYGLLNYVDGSMLWPDQQGGCRVDHGVAIITMSSNVGFNLTMQRRGLPVAFVLCLGNRLRFDLDDAIRSLAREESVSAIGLYIEGISRPVAFEAAAAFARDLGKPLVALKAGRSEVAQQIALSHAATLAGSDDLVDVLFERAAVARVDSLEELVETLKILHLRGPLPGRSIGAMSTSGGDLAMVGDAIRKYGLEATPLSESDRGRIATTVHQRVVVRNPLDNQMFDWQNEDRLTATFSAFLAAEFDVSVCVLDYPRSDRCDPSTWSTTESAFVRAARRSTSTAAVVMATLPDNMPESIAEGLSARGIIPLAGLEAGFAAIRAAAEIGELWQRAPASSLFEMEPLPATRTGQPEQQFMDEARSKAALTTCGVPVPASEVVLRTEVARAATKIGFPVVLKALGVAHKTESGAVELALDSGPAVAAAAEKMAHLSDRFLVEEMIDGVVIELIVGAVRDQQFGIHLVIGSGGVLVELSRDSSPVLLPTSRRQIVDVLSKLKCWPLFEGYRGGPRADLEATVDAIERIAAFVYERRSSLIELDVNPLMVLAAGRGVVAGDVLMRVAEDAEEAGV